MANSNGKITAPVGIGDIQTVLSSGETSIGRLCRLPVINMWAKYKPLKGCPIDITNQMSNNTWRTDTYLVNHSITPWWRGTDGKYGLDYSGGLVTASTGQNDFHTALNSLANNKVDGNLNGWEYKQPNGNGTIANGDLKSYYNFLGYNHNAPKPVQAMSTGDEIVGTRGYNGSLWTLELDWRSSDDNDSGIDNRDFLMVKDIITNRPLYEGIAIYRKDSNGDYDVMAWNIGHTWTGKGLFEGETSSTGETQDHAEFKYSGTYYAIPVLFSPSTALTDENQLAQTTPNYSNKPSSGTPYPIWIITYPYTDFVEFTTRRVESAQRYGYPWLSNSKALPPLSGSTLCSWASRLYIDKTVDPDWYNNTNSFTLTVYVVDDTWDGTPPNDVNRNITKTITVPTNTRYTAIEWGANKEYSILQLDINHQWYVMVYMSGYGLVRKIALIMPPANSLQTT